MEQFCILIGNDKSTAKLSSKSFSRATSHDSAEIALRNVLYHFCEYLRRRGYDATQNSKSIHIVFKQFRFEIFKQLPFDVLIYINPIEVMGNQYFNYIKTTFTFAETRKMFFEAKKILCDLLKDFAVFPQEEYANLFVHESWTISKASLARCIEEKGRVDLKDVIKFKQEEYLRDFPFFRVYAQSLEDGIFDLVQLSITIDIHCQDEREKQLLFNYFSKVVMPSYKKVTWEQEHVRWRPFNNEAKTYRKDLPTIRIYVKYFDVKHKAHELLAKLKALQRSGNVELKPGAIEEIKAEVREALFFLRHTIRFEFDYASRESIKARFGTNSFEERIMIVRSKYNERGREKEVPAISVNNLELANELFETFLKYSTEVIIEPNKARDLVERNFEYLKMLQFDRKEVSFLLDKDEKAVRKAYSRLKKEKVIDGRGNNAIVLEPFRGILNELQSEEAKTILRELTDPEGTLPYILYNNNTIGNTDCYLNNISISNVTYTRKRDTRFFERAATSRPELEIIGTEEPIEAPKMSHSQFKAQILAYMGNRQVRYEELEAQGFTLEQISTLKRDGDALDIKPGVLMLLK